MRQQGIRIVDISGPRISLVHCTPMSVCVLSNASVLVGEIASLVYFQVFNSDVLGGLHFYALCLSDQINLVIYWWVVAFA